MSINSPSKGICTAEHFTKFILIPQYKGVRQTWPNCDIQVSILLFEDCEDVEFFNSVNKYLKMYCPELLGRYVLVRKD